MSAARRPAPAPTITVPLALFEDMVGVLAERFSKDTHVMQLVTNESRGHCTPRGCAPICIGHRATFHAACDELVRAGVLDPIPGFVAVEVPTQGDLFAADVAG